MCPWFIDHRGVRQLRRWSGSPLLPSTDARLECRLLFASSSSSSLSSSFVAWSPIFSLCWARNLSGLATLSDISAGLSFSVSSGGMNHNVAGPGADRARKPAVLLISNPPSAPLLCFSFASGYKVHSSRYSVVTVVAEIGAGSVFSFFLSTNCNYHLE